MDSRRVLLNEKYLERSLRRLNHAELRFNVIRVNVGQLQSVDRVAIASKAHVLVGLHGLNMLNFLGLYQGTIIIEIQTTGFPTVEYENVAIAMGHSFIRYRNLDTKRQFRWKNHASGTSNQQLEHHSSLNVSIEDIQSVFQTLLRCLASCDGS